MKQSIEMVIDTILSAGLAVRCTPDVLNRPLPSCEKLTLEEGDRFEVPEDFEVLATSFQDGGIAPFIYVEVHDACDTVAPFRLYPTIFFRSVRDLDGRRISTKGTVPDVLKYLRDYRNVMDFLRGKRIVVTGVHCVETRQPQTGRVISRRVYDFDFC